MEHIEWKLMTCRISLENLKEQILQIITYSWNLESTIINDYLPQLHLKVSDENWEKLSVPIDSMPKNTKLGQPKIWSDIFPDSVVNHKNFDSWKTSTKLLRNFPSPSYCWLLLTAYLHPLKENFMAFKMIYNTYLNSLNPAYK